MKNFINKYFGFLLLGAPAYAIIAVILSVIIAMIDRYYSPAWTRPAFLAIFVVVSLIMTLVLLSSLIKDKE